MASSTVSFQSINNTFIVKYLLTNISSLVKLKVYIVKISESMIFIFDLINHRFPYVQSRMGKYEYEDKKILCIAALDFYRQVSEFI